ncbi:hypothetical protein HYPSUDRAFT_850344 [Hypholoma sublateritium FD-334 SS-4]|uniref:Uncharacterized protein n=1 Tax=Hypholoma sublateritium (strain FD-334 SS-4) TaxID=945553 RepID=A0A0D2NTB4_HYPSF|nr:hypothetical protein HYPSUDRAFT_850344 [Hypholoma sublateritium FD-334 SS-4]
MYDLPNLPDLLRVNFFRPSASFPSIKLTGSVSNTLSFILILILIVSLFPLDGGYLGSSTIPLISLNSNKAIGGTLSHRRQRYLILWQECQRRPEFAHRL